MNKRSLAAVILLCGTMAGSATYLVAQPGGKASEGEAKKPQRSPLPFYYGKIGVSDEQREQMYAVQDEYSAKAAPLIEQIRMLRVARDQKLEGLLTAGQKLRMKELREEAEKRSENKKADAETGSDAEVGEEAATN